MRLIVCFQTCVCLHPFSRTDDEEQSGTTIYGVFLQQTRLHISEVVLGRGPLFH